jgi:predicted permease
MAELRRSLRILGKNWKLTAMAMFSLSMAMALGVVCLSVSDTSLLVPPAGVAPGRLVTVYLKSPGTPIDHISYPDYEYYRDNNHVFTDVAAMPESITAFRVGFGAAGQKDRPLVTVAYNSVSENYFSVLGLKPYLGRLFASGDDNSQSSIAVMTYSCWKRLGSDRNVVGKLVGSFSIVGVAPKEFTGSLFGMNGDLLVPLSGNDVSSKRDERHLYLLARLKPGVSRTRAQADVAVLSRQLAASYPTEDKDRTAILTRATLLAPDMVPAAEIVLAVLLLLVLLVLLIACANVANLLLALAVGRRQEATIKMALGASRSRLIREFLGEGAIISAASSALGYALAAVAVVRFATFNVNVPMIGSYAFGLKLHLDPTVLASTIALMFLAILATGLPAALYASSPKIAEILSGEIVVGGTRKTMRRNALVIGQVSVSTLVLIGMGLCERSLYNLRHVNPGFSARNIVTEDLLIGGEGRSEAQGKELYLRVRQSVAAIPGVESVALGFPPLLGSNERVPVRLPGAEKPLSVPSGLADVGYFATWGIPLLAGRVFHSSDAARSPDVLVINRKMAETLWPGQDAVGRALLTGDPPHAAVVIGVVGDGKYADLDEDPQPYLYYALSQHYAPEISVMARTRGDPRLWIQPLVQAIEKAGLAALLAPMTLENIENLSLLPERIVAGCVAALSVLGLLLAGVGLFGAISYSVSERKKEFGIRVALGAQPWQLLKMVFAQTFSIVGVGTMIGIMLGVGVTLVVRSEFYRVGAVEWSVLVPVGAAMLAVSLAIAYLSARPWIKVDPLEAVRHA